MKKVLVLILVVFILGSGPAWAQEKGAAKVQEHEKHHPAPPETKQPLMGQGMMMCPCMMMPLMVQHMQKMMPLMEKIIKEKKMSPEATKQMQDMMTQMQGMMTQMQGQQQKMQEMMKKMPMMQHETPGPSEPQKKK